MKLLLGTQVSLWSVDSPERLSPAAATALLDREMRANRIAWLALERHHLRAVAGLPWVHRDPFDRLLVAQAVCEGMAIVTSDENIPGYAIEAVW